MNRQWIYIFSMISGTVLLAWAAAAAQPRAVSLRLGTIAHQGEPQREWPGFRGPGASGIAEGHQTPVEWDLRTNRNVAWKRPIPGLGHSSPVVWGDLVCLTTATSEIDQALRVGMSGDILPVHEEGPFSWQVICVDKGSGQVRWQREAARGAPAIRRHPKGTHANSTLAIDGEHIVAFFGSEGLYCYDMEGNLLWQKDLGVLDSAFFMVPSAQWGFASSPIIHDGRVIVQADVLNGSFLAAFAVQSGEELWRARRGDVPTWSTPAIYSGQETTQVVVNGYRHIGGYDVTNGEEVWRMSGGGDIPVPTPVVSGDLIFVTNSHGSTSPIYAIRATASGDISLEAGESSNLHVAWSQSREGAYIPTPLVYGDHLYLLRDNGVLAVYERETGERLYRQRIGQGGSGFSASPVAADGKIYFASEDGDVYVVEAGAEFELLAENEMGEVCMATPAISSGTLFIRTRSHLVAISLPVSPFPLPLW